MKSTQSKKDNIKTLVYGQLPSEEKAKFLEFMVSNNVEFTRDPEDGMYIATIRIINANSQSPDQQYNSTRPQTTPLLPPPVK